MVLGSVRGWLDERPVFELQASSTYRRDISPDKIISATIVVDEVASVPHEIQQQVEDSLAATDHMSEAERLTALDAAAGRLARISSESSVDDVAKQLQSWLGLTPRAAEPKATDRDSNSQTAVSDEDGFDFESAQLHDVRREVLSDDRAQFICVMLDAKGRTLDVPLSEAEGAPIYTLMEKIKASPLLEQIYRQLAMPMLDELVRAQRTASIATDATRGAADGQQAANSAISSDPPKNVESYSKPR